MAILLQAEDTLTGRALEVKNGWLLVLSSCCGACINTDVDDETHRCGFCGRVDGKNFYAASIMLVFCRGMEPDTWEAWLRVWFGIEGLSLWMEASDD